MIYLELILLAIGFLISSITLSREEKKEKHKLKKVLACCYIFLFIISVVFAVVKYSSDKTSDNKLYNSLGDIEREINVQSDKLIALLGNTINLNQKLDSIASKTEIAIKQREKSLKVFEEQNKLLEQSNNLTEKRLIDERPIVAVDESGIQFISIDSTKIKCRITFVNVGKRKASKFSDLITFIFKNKYGIYYKHESTESAYRNGGQEVHVSSGITTTSIINLSSNYIETQTNGGTIVIYFRYYDELLKKYSIEETILDFSKNIESNNIYDILKKGDPKFEIGLDQYLTKFDIKSELIFY